MNRLAASLAATFGTIRRSRPIRAYVALHEEADGTIRGEVMTKEHHEGRASSGCAFAVRASTRERVRELAAEVAPSRGYQLVPTSEEL